MRFRELRKNIIISIILMCLASTIVANAYGCNGPAAVGPAAGTGISTELIQVKSSVFNMPVHSTTEHVEVGRIVEIGENFIVFIVM